jgi:hypothetical protein
MTDDSIRRCWFFLLLPLILPLFGIAIAAAAARESLYSRDRLADQHKTSQKPPAKNISMVRPWRGRCIWSLRDWSFIICARAVSGIGPAGDPGM